MPLAKVLYGSHESYLSYLLLALLAGLILSKEFYLDPNSLSYCSHASYALKVSPMDLRCILVYPKVILMDPMLEESLLWI